MRKSSNGLYHSLFVPVGTKNSIYIVACRINLLMDGYVLQNPNGHTPLFIFIPFFFCFLPSGFYQSCLLHNRILTESELFKSFYIFKMDSELSINLKIMRFLKKDMLDCLDFGKIQL